MLLSPLANAVKHAPNLQFDSGVEPERKKELGLRALAFMEPRERDAIVLHAGMLLSAWKPADIQLVPKEELSADVEVIKETYLRHKPAKFHELRPVVKSLTAEAERLKRIENSLYAASNATVVASSTAPTTGTFWFSNPEISMGQTTNTQLVQPVNTWSVQITAYNQAMRTNTWVESMSTNRPTTVINDMRTNHHVDANLAVMVNQYIATSTHYQRVSTFDTGAWGEAARLARYEQERQAAPSRAKRKVIRRQIDLLGAVLQSPNDVHVFLRGESLTVQSETTGMKYRFTRGKELTVNKLVSPSFSTPYDLEVLSEDDIFLTKMCVYVKDTPMLDQLAAMMLYVQSGEDLSLLSTGNFHSLGDCERLNAELTRLGLLKKKVHVPEWIVPETPTTFVMEEAPPTATTNWVYNVDLSNDDATPTTEVVVTTTDNALATFRVMAQSGATYDSDMYDDQLDEVSTESAYHVNEQTEPPTPLRLMSEALETIHMTPPRSIYQKEPPAIHDYPEVVAVREMFKDFYLLKLFNPK